MIFDKEKTYDFHDMIGNPGELKKFASFLSYRGENIPSFIKQSSDLVTKPSSLEDDEFGLIVKQAGEKLRKFPLDSAESAWLSQQSFLMNSNNLPVSCVAVAAATIKKACDFYGIEADKEVMEHSSYNVSETNEVNLDDPFIKKAEEMIKRKKSVEFYALPGEERYPLDTANQVKEAVSFFDKNHESMEMDKVASDFAKELKKGCIRQKMEIPDLVWKYTSDCSTTNEEILKIAFDDRIKRMKERGAKEKEMVTAKLAYDSILSAFDYKKPHEIVSLIKQADQNIAEVFRYTNILSPEQLVYEGHSFFSKIAENSALDMPGISGLGELPKNLNEGGIYNSSSPKNEVNTSEKKEKVRDVLEKYPDAFRGFTNSEILDDLNSDFDLTFDNLSAYDRDVLFDVAKRYE